MSATSEERFELLIGQAMSAPVSGWRFPFLDERLVRVPQSWDYVAAARALLKASRSAVDHGTGGGEILLDTGVVPPRLVATEAYPPNVAVAQRHLQPVGAWVVQVSAETHNSLGPGANNEVPSRRLPFRDEAFDLFMCRNGAFCAGEVFRLLCPGGQLVHQSGMVGPPRPGHRSLRDYFEPTPTGPGAGGWLVRESTLEAGFLVLDYREELARTMYLDIGAVVFALRMAPWTIGSFGDTELRERRGRLLELHEQIESDGPLVTAGTAIFLHASKP